MYSLIYLHVKAALYILFGLSVKLTFIFCLTYLLFLPLCYVVLI